METLSLSASQKGAGGGERAGREGKDKSRFCEPLKYENYEQLNVSELENLDVIHKLLEKHRQFECSMKSAVKEGEVWRGKTCIVIWQIKPPPGLV